MADICEICIRIIEFREEGAMVEYDYYCLCAKCHKKVKSHNKKFPRRSFERCVKEIQKERNKIFRTEK